MMEKMYYYTSTDTMCKVLQSGNLFATNLNYMNDAQEYINGLEEIRNVMLNEELIRERFKAEDGQTVESLISLIKHEFSEARLKKYRQHDTNYSLSFCREKDLLSQWTTYARESGVSMEMEFDISSNVCFRLFRADLEGEGQGKEKDNKIEVRTHPVKILYLTKGKGNDSYKKTAQQVLEIMFPKEDGISSSDLSSRLMEGWRNSSIYIKQYDFFQEAEYRIPFTYTGMDMDGNPRIDYRTDKYVIKPYLDVECENGWPVTAVMVGPGFNQQIVYRSVRFFLDHANIKSSRLRTRRQWKEQVIEYLNGPDGGRSDLGHMQSDSESSIERAKLEKMKNSLLREMDQVQALGADKKICGSERNLLHTQVNEFVKQYSMICEDADKNYFTTHYLTESGLILECSSTPYIY